MDPFGESETAGFLFIWSIENLSCLPKPVEEFNSPVFVVDTLNNTSWKLELYSKECDNCGGYIGCFLERCTDNGPENITLDYELSFYGSALIDKKKIKEHEFKKDGCHNELALLSSVWFDETYGRQGSNLLHKGTLTVCCRMWSSNSEIFESRQCYARTRMRFESSTYYWNLDQFSTFQSQEKEFQIESFFDYDQNRILTTKISHSDGLCLDNSMEIKIYRDDDYDLSFCACKVSVLNVEGKVDFFKQDQHWFDPEDLLEIWKFPSFMSKSWLIERKDQYLLNDILSLRFDFATCIGPKFNEIEYSIHGPPASQTLGEIINEMHKYCKHPGAVTAILNNSESLKDDLQCLYNQKSFSDLTLQTSNAFYRVHKAIICARSPPFSAMFEQDAKGKRTGVVKVYDLDDDTVQRMLMFMYTDRVDEHQWEKISKLYLAADKYGILSLKEKCANLLISNLSTSNVCEILVFAHKHQDADIKSSAQHFIFNYDSEIIILDAWKKFVEHESQLASETMEILYMKWLKI